MKQPRPDVLERSRSLIQHIEDLRRRDRAERQATAALRARASEAPEVDIAPRTRAALEAALGIDDATGWPRATTPRRRATRPPFLRA